MEHFRKSRDGRERVDGSSPSEASRSCCKSAVLPLWLRRGLPQVHEHGKDTTFVVAHLMASGVRVRAASVRIDRIRTETESSGDVVVGVTLVHERQDLALARS